MKRTIEISTRGLHLSARNQQLTIASKEKELGQVPFEDLGVLILDSTAITITTAALASAVNHGAVVVICANNHHPEGMLLPLVGHTTQSERLQAQVRMSRPLAKNLWRMVVQSKLRGQAEALGDTAGRSQIEALMKKVRSGDPANIEAQGARIYWPCLLGPEFRRRREEGGRNALLNYGYMIIRASVARAVVAAGLVPGLGIHHHNRYDGFCLADDLMEPFRPWVDRRVRKLADEGRLEINKETKRYMLEVLTDKSRNKGSSGPLLVAIERTASSLAKVCLQQADPTNDLDAKSLSRLLILPEGLPQEEC